MGKFSGLPTEFLEKNYVPDIYQHDIYDIDFQRLKDAGVTFISFDIDDTIVDIISPTPSKEAKDFFADLKKDGFTLMLLTNNTEKKGEKFARELGIDGHYIGEAKKPCIDNFQKMQERFGLEKEQMAHVGNSLMKDVAGANSFGITSCLVRDMGKLINIAHLAEKIIGKETDGQKMRKELQKRNLWRKKHKYEKGDQYYQLGETPSYKKQDIK
ncbi:MAG: HAD family hydrolase [Ruminococcus sp.]|nr:HAD family hydrolase [Ruminococcus sp.]MCM1381210.1 HAD family hydrolase [Muribaculaceae bacterium]MCM1478720.1 HAD family hydrolase [Muribaculaceae bacterium]